MPRPLKILKNIAEEDPSATHNKINELLGETTAISEEIFRHLATCLRLLINKDGASVADQDIVDLGVRLWNDIRAANMLVRRGLYLSAMMMERDAIETIVVAEYLHNYPQDAELWRKAETISERRRFSIHRLRDKVEDGKDWKDTWDWLSSFIHPNCLATPVYGASKEFFGHNLYIGGFYQPGSIVTCWGIQLALCFHFLQSFISWYKDELPFPPEMQGGIEALEEAYHDKTDKLKERAYSEQKDIHRKIEATRFSREEVIKVFKFLDTLS